MLKYAILIEKDGFKKIVKTDKPYHYFRDERLVDSATNEPLVAKRIDENTIQTTTQSEFKTIKFKYEKKEVKKYLIFFTKTYYYYREI